MHARLGCIRETLDGPVGTECRFIVRGLSYTFQGLQACVRTPRRSGERSVNAIPVDTFEFVLASPDVSRTFDIEIVFEDVGALSRAGVHAVPFNMSNADVKFPRQRVAFNAFDPSNDAFTVVEPIYAFEDAFVVWRAKLHHVLVGWFGRRQLRGEPECHCVRGGVADP